MNVWAFVVVIRILGGTIQSEAFDYQSAASCQQKRENVVAYLLDEQRVAEFYVGECKKIVLTKKS